MLNDRTALQVGEPTSGHFDPTDDSGALRILHGDFKNISYGKIYDTAI